MQVIALSPKEHQELSVIQSYYIKQEYTDNLGARMIRQPLQVHFNLVNGPLHIFQFLQRKFSFTMAEIFQFSPSI